MAENIPKILEKGFQNWLKANLALNITKDGLEDAVVNEIETFHRDLLNEILTPEQILNKDFCTQCTKENILRCPTRGICVVKSGECSIHNTLQKYYRPCPNRICDRLRDKIKKCHRFNFPSWKNTNTEKWCQNPWELAKCYLPPDGYIAVNTIAETDLNGILSLIMNHAVFKNQVDEKACEKNRDIGKILRHSPNLSIDDKDLNTYLDTMVTFLSCPSLFQRDLKAAASVKKITKLKGESLTITTNDVTRVLRDVINENTRDSLEKINETTVKRVGEVKANLDQLEARASKNLQDILTAKKAAIADIDTTRATAIQDLRSSAEQMKSEINKEKLAAEAHIQSYTESSTEAAKTELKSSAEGLMSDMNKDVNRTKLAVEAHIQSYTESSTEAAKTELKSSVEGLMSDMNKDVNRTKLAVEAHIQSYTESSTEAAKTELKSSAEGLMSDMNTDINRTKQAVEAHIQSYSDKSVETAKEQLNKEIAKIKLATEPDVQNTKKSLIEEIKRESSAIKVISIKEIEKAATDVSKPVHRLTEADYQLLKDEFREDLLAFNRENHSTIPLSPLFDEHDTALIGFYVLPAMSSIEIQKTELRGPAIEVRTPIFGLRDVFHKKSYRCKNVVLTSEAGQGKTAFCKHLALIWCNAHQINSKERRHFPNDDLLTMREFDYLFLVSLRDSSAADCDIDDMIRNQVVQYLSRAPKYTADFIQTVFHKELTLVLLDGLDEWSHPEQKDSTCRKKPDYLPHRKVREKCTILTTTRSWKLSIANLKSSQIDNHIEIGSLDSKQLMKNTFSKINKGISVPDVVEQNIEKINAEIRSRSIEEFEGNPLILTYLICLWCDGKPIGHSRCEFYTNILELLLFRATGKYVGLERKDFALDDKDSVTLPTHFETRNSIKTSYNFLISIGQLAFQALFDRNKERSLVFDYSLVNSIMTKQAYQFSLLAGLLVQSKVPGQLTSRDTRISFSHKTFQEFFAAWYIQSLPDASQVSAQVLDRCNTVEAILEMANVFIFLSGLGPDKARILSKNLCACVNEDERTVEHRRALSRSNTSYRIFKDLQYMCIACVKESRNDDHNIILQDIILDKDCCDEKYSHLLQRLTLMNIKNIKSVQYNHSVSEDTTRDTVRLFHLKEINTLETLIFACPIITDDLETLLAGSVDTLKRIEVQGCRFQKSRYIQTYNNISNSSVTSLRNMNQLECLLLESIEMSHTHLECLLSHLSQKTNTCMKEIILFGVKCIDHSEKCQGFHIDLPQHSQLKVAGFGGLHLSHLHVNTSALDLCFLGEIHNGNAFSSFVRYLPSESTLKHLHCRRLAAGLDVVLDTISLLSHLQTLRIVQSDIRNRLLKLSPNMKDIENITMIDASMTGTSFEQLVKGVGQFQQSVRVVLRDCVVTPAEEYERVKNYIRSADGFEVLEDRVTENIIGQNFNTFAFETISLNESENVC